MWLTNTKGYDIEVSFWEVPNFWTVLRMILAFPAALLIWLLNTNYTPNGYFSTLLVILTGVLAVGCLSDFLDGYLARKYNAESRLGAFLDSLADKLFYLLPFWFLMPFIGITIFYLTLAAEFLLVFQRVVKISFDKGDIKANIFGKAKVVFQFSAIFIFVFGLLFMQLADDYLPREFVWQYGDMIVKVGALMIITAPPLLAKIGFIGSLLSLAGQILNLALCPKCHERYLTIPGYTFNLSKRPCPKCGSKHVYRSEVDFCVIYKCKHCGNLEELELVELKNPE